MYVYIYILAGKKREREIYVGKIKESIWPPNLVPPKNQLGNYLFETKGVVAAGSQRRLWHRDHVPLAGACSSWAMGATQGCPLKWWDPTHIICVDMCVYIYTYVYTYIHNL